MELLTVSEMRAVLAHEFGHYHGGDTAIGPWVYRTRESIVRTIRHVGRFSSLLHLPFRWYAIMFLRISQAVSRSQEFAADRLAAAAVGGAAMTSALSKLAEGQLALDVYWQREFVPVVNAGLRPPMVDGFAHFMSQEAIREQLHRIVSERSATAMPNPYDSHPATGDRIAALARLEAGPDPRGEPAATILLREVPSLEQAALQPLLRGDAPPLHAVAWDQVGTLYVLPVWRRRLEEHGPLLGAATVVDLPALARDAPQLGSRIPNASGSGGADWARQAGLQLLTAALGVALAARGWIVESRPGEPLALCSGPTRFDPVGVVNDLNDGRMDDGTWANWCQEAGLSDVALGAARAAANS
jgi:hypothetical protein